jgi:hypothetical protein
MINISQHNLRRAYESLGQSRINRTPRICGISVGR